MNILSNVIADPPAATHPFMSSNTTTQSLNPVSYNSVMILLSETFMISAGDVFLHFLDLFPSFSLAFSKEIDISFSTYIYVVISVIVSL